MNKISHKKPRVLLNSKKCSKCDGCEGRVKNKYSIFSSVTIGDYIRGL